MVPTGVAETVELIWHFAGYLHLDPNDWATTLVKYEGDARHPMRGDDIHLPTTEVVLPPPAILYSAPLHPHDIPGPDPLQFAVARPPIGPTHLAHDLPITAKPHPLPLLPAHLAAGVDGGGGDGWDFSMSVTYTPGGDQAVSDVRQVNVLFNDDHVSAGPIDIALPSHDDSSLFVRALERADHAVPDQFALPADHSSTGIEAFVANRDLDPNLSYAPSSHYAAIDGQYLDGIKQDPSVDVHQSANDLLTALVSTLDSSGNLAPVAPTGDHSADHIQNAFVGSNVTANDAVVGSFSGLSGSMLVMGDSFQTQLVAQVNVLVQNNDLAAYGPASDAMHLTIDPNIVHNVADFQTVGAVGGAWMVGGPTSWAVDVLNGSFVDLKTFSQTNYLVDNDVVSQTQSTGESQIVAGSNGMINALDFLNLSAQYDLIIVEGSYHRADLIYQTNVVVDANHAWQIGSGAEAGGAPGSSSISAGGDALLNDATIIYQGAQDSQPVTSGMIDLVHALDAQNGTLTSSQIDAAFPNLAGTAHVLLVTGDYWDVTSLSQVNVISDSNSVAQVMLANGGQQSLVAGHDHAINAATIVDGGSLTTPFVQGTAYSDSVLIQTNMVSTDAKVTVNDPHQLAPELVAFVGAPDTSSAPVDAPQLFGPSDSHQHDGMAGVMHA